MATHGLGIDFPIAVPADELVDGVGGDGVGTPVEVRKNLLREAVFDWAAGGHDLVQHRAVRDIEGLVGIDVADGNRFEPGFDHALGGGDESTFVLVDPIDIHRRLTPHIEDSLKALSGDLSQLHEHDIHEYLVIGPDEAIEHDAVRHAHDDVRKRDIGTDLDIEAVVRAEAPIPIKDARIEFILFRSHVINSQIEAGHIHRRCYPEHPATKTPLPKWEGAQQVEFRYASRHRPRRTPSWPPRPSRPPLVRRARVRHLRPSGSGALRAP